MPVNRRHRGRGQKRSDAACLQSRTGRRPVALDLCSWLQLSRQCRDRKAADRERSRVCVLCQREPDETEMFATTVAEQTRRLKAVEFWFLERTDANSWADRSLAAVLSVGFAFL